VLVAGCGLLLLVPSCGSQAHGASAEADPVYPPPVACRTGPNIASGGLAGPAQPPASCVKPPPSAPTTGAPLATSVQDLGVVTVGQSVAFTVPPSTGTLSVVLEAQDVTIDTVTITISGEPPFALFNWALPLQLSGPDGLYYDFTAPEPADPVTALVYQPIHSPWSATMTLPNTSALLNRIQATGLAPGTWTLRVGDLAFDCTTPPPQTSCNPTGTTATYHAYAILKGGGSPAPTALDVAVYVVNRPGTPNFFSSAQAGNDVDVKRFVSTLGAYLANAGICLGTVTFYDVPGWAQDRYATGIDPDRQGPCDDISQMFLLAAGKPATAINLFLVESIRSSATQTTTVGVDGNIPGPSTVPGTLYGGAAVSAADLRAGSPCAGTSPQPSCGADAVAYVAAHEAGHWLGLFHTTEEFGETFDPIADTPTCRCETCVSGSARLLCGDPTRPTEVGTAACSQSDVCGGAENLMFWLVSPQLQGLLSAEQGDVVRRNPIVH
jgi:hypothetical protein